MHWILWKLFEIMQIFDKNKCSLHALACNIVFQWISIKRIHLVILAVSATCSPFTWQACQMGINISVYQRTIISFLIEHILYNFIRHDHIAAYPNIAHKMYNCRYAHINLSARFTSFIIVLNMNRKLWFYLHAIFLNAHICFISYP